MYIVDLKNLVLPTSNLMFRENNISTYQFFIDTVSQEYEAGVAMCPAGKEEGVAGVQDTWATGSKNVKMLVSRAPEKPAATKGSRQIVCKV